jgi:hypothetical protein
MIVVAKVLLLLLLMVLIVEVAVARSSLRFSVVFLASIEYAVYAGVETHDGLNGPG